MKRQGREKRVRMDWSQRLEDLNDKEFRARYQLTKPLFADMIQRIRPLVYATHRNRRTRVLLTELAYERIQGTI